MVTYRLLLLTIVVTLISSCTKPTHTELQPSEVIEQYFAKILIEGDTQGANLYLSQDLINEIGDRRFKQYDDAVYNPKKTIINHDTEKATVEYSLSAILSNGEEKVLSQQANLRFEGGRWLIDSL